MAMRIRRERPTEGHVVSAALLLANSPRGCSSLHLQVPVDQLRPFDSTLDA